jgi:threonine synthase
MDWDGLRFQLKLEFLTPTGSYKDRGMAIMVTALRGLGVHRVVEDSSGNAGASLAAYAARASIDCEVCVPGTAAGPKLAQMVASGAEVIQIKGKREYASLAAWAAAAHGAYYASHVYNPYFLAGTETLAYELWEQLGGRSPSALVLPLGNGSLLLGLYRGFQRLLDAGLSVRLPRLFAVQVDACAPIYQAFVLGRDEVEPCSSVPTVARSLAIMYPARGAQALAAVRATGGRIVTAGDREILAARNQLARLGFYVEEAAAAALAALPKLGESLSHSLAEHIVVPLTGHGLKTASSHATSPGLDT